MFEDVDGAPRFHLAEVKRLRSDVLVLVYEPDGS
jgi:hypothetical protein